MSEERERLSKGETGGEREKLSDVEAHKMGRLSEADEKRDKIAQTDDEADVEAHKLSRLSEAEEKRDKVAQTDDEADVEGHMLNPKMNRMDP